MADLRLQDGGAEPWVGANHPTLADTMNRLFLGGAAPVFRDVDGKNLAVPYKKRETDPSTGADEVALFCKLEGSTLGLFLRLESDGDITRLA